MNLFVWNKNEDNSTMSNRDTGLLSLSQFVSEFLASTTNVKGMLEAECEEARYVLKPWQIETTITKEIDDSCCTCELKASLEDHVEKIVEGIGKALSQAQELREKIAINVAKEKRKAREPNLQSIYMPTSVPNRTKVFPKKDQSIKSQKTSTKSSTSELTDAASKIPNAKKGQSVKVKNIETKTVTEKKLLRTSLGNAMSSKNSTKPAKNFVAANKTNIKKLGCFSKSTIDLTCQTKKTSDSTSPSSGKSQVLSGCSKSIAELNNLVEKISVAERTSGSGISSLQSEDHSCPLHGENAQRFVDEKIRTTVDMIEGLDRYGVPSDVVRILKMYHAYLNEEFADERVVKKGRRAADKFLVEFDTMNEERASIRHPKDLANLTIDFACLLRDSHLIGNFFASSSEMRSVSLRYAELDARRKNCQLKKFDAVEFRKPKLSTNPIKYDCSGKGWLSNGVWNRTVITDCFPGIRQSRCIRYANKGQLLSFFEDTQRLQRLFYHRDLMALLLTKVIPDIRQNYDPLSEEYREAYKTISTIAQEWNEAIETTAVAIAIRCPGIRSI